MLIAEDEDASTATVARVTRVALLRDGITLRLRPLASLTITVRDAAGKPLRGAQVSLYGYYDYQGPQTSDAKGRVVFKTLYPGEKYTSSTELLGYRRSSYPNLPRVGSRKWTGKAEIVLQYAGANRPGPGERVFRAITRVAD